MSTFRFTKTRKLAILHRMRELLERRGGWVKETLDNGRGGYCLLGAESRAIRELYGKSVLNTGGRKLSIYAAAKARGFPYVSAFNDSPKTRKADVLALVDEKIAELSA